jgi:hypothetical protein
MPIMLIPDWKGWEVGSEDEDSDDSGGWIDVSSDEEKGIEISDSEDEEPMRPPGRETQSESNTSTLATTKVCLSSSQSNIGSHSG